MGEPLYSPDGKHFWNGHEWVRSFRDVPPPPPSPPPAYQRPAPISQRGWIAMAVLGAILMGGWLFIVANKPAPAPAEQGPPTGASGCRPPPCVNSEGLEVFVTNVNRNAISEPGFGLPPTEHYVVVNVRWEYHGDKTGNPNPIGFGLVSDYDKIKVPLLLGCPRILGSGDWESVNITDGGVYGPNPLCFKVAGPTTAPLTLLWSHNLFGDDAKMPLG